MREVIRPLSVWDAAAQSEITLPPGTLLHSCRIHRTDGAADAYVMRFVAANRHYECPLFCFQPRTRSVPAPAAVE